MTTPTEERCLANEVGQRPLPMITDLRMHPILCVPALLRELGVEPDPIIERSGINPRAFDDPENRVPFSAVGRLLAICAAVTERPDFGLLVGQRAGGSVLGAIGELARHSPSVHQALRTLMVYFHLHDRGAVPVLHSRSQGEAELVYVMHRHDLGTALIADGAIAIGCQFLRSLCGPRWTPLGVTFSHSRPREVTPYRCFFRAPVRFDAPHTALVFDSGWLDESVPDADPREHVRLFQRVIELDSSRESTVTERVGRMLLHLTIAGKPTAGKVACLLGWSRRTLHRRLAAEGTSIRTLMEDMHRQLARQLVEDTQIPLSEIAAALHYSELSAFSRAFRAWTGMTPSDCRANGGNAR